VRRGELWTLRDDQYASKARPVVVVQADTGHDFDSTIVCLLTTFDSDDVSTRVLIKAARSNGLARDSWVMTEKIATVAVQDLGQRVGELSDADMARIAAQLAVLLGMVPPGANH